MPCDGLLATGDDARPKLLGLAGHTPSSCAVVGGGMRQNEPHVHKSRRGIRSEALNC